MAGEDEDDEDDDTDSRTTTQLGGVQKVGTSSTDSSSSIDSPVKPQVKRSKSVSQQATAKKIISSTKDNLRRLASRHIVESTRSNPTAAVPSPPPTNQLREAPEETVPSKNAVDHIYEHLFFAEEQARRAAATAVTPVQPMEAHRHAPRPMVTPSPLEPLPEPSNLDRVGIIPLRRMTQPFPISTPHASTAVPQPSTQPVHTVSTSISRNFTFDDDISAISAHTLEAMMMTIPQQQNSNRYRNDETLLVESVAASMTDFQADFPTLPLVTPPLKSAIPLSNAAFCRASTIPRANQANHSGREDIERWNSLSSSGTLRSKRASFNSADRFDTRSPPGYGTPTSNRSMTSNHSKPQQRFGSSFSPCTSGSGNQSSHDHWRTVEQEFWDSVVAREDDHDNGEPGVIVPPKKNRHPRRSRSRIRSADGWSEHSTHSRTRDPTDGSIFSSSLTAISHSGSSHGIRPNQRSQSWLALHPKKHPHETFPVIFASTAIPDNDGFLLDHRPSSLSSFHFNAMESGEI